MFVSLLSMKAETSLRMSHMRLMTTEGNTAAENRGDVGCGWVCGLGVRGPSVRRS